jgi:hypothetical protein
MYYTNLLKVIRLNLILYIVMLYVEGLVNDKFTINLLKRCVFLMPIDIDRFKKLVHKYRRPAPTAGSNLFPLLVE